MFEFLNGFKDESLRALLYFLTLVFLVFVLIIWFIFVPIPFIGNNLDEHIEACSLVKYETIDGQRIRKEVLNKDCSLAILKKYYRMEIE